MKKILTILSILPLFAAAQHPCANIKQRSAASLIQARLMQNSKAAASATENKYDMKFVHLDLNIESNTKYISGSAKHIATVSSAALDTFAVLLEGGMTVDSVHFNGQKLPFGRIDSLLYVVPSPVPQNAASFTVQVWYNGTPIAGSSALGDGFSSAQEWDYGQDVTWSLSEPFAAYQWWPTKQVLTDKIDSSWVFITTSAANMGGSNGRLVNVVNLGTTKRYEWKSRSPIDYYLISVAVSDYSEYNLYAKPKYLNDSVLIQNFVYTPCLSDNGWLGQDKVQLDRVPKALEFFSEMYGMYPFYKEKYGHCLVPIGGGMEHQTMTSQGFLFYYPINAHELAHQWWGNNVTCKSWADIWINEGFASYSEHLANEYLRPTAFAQHLQAAHGDVMNSPGGSIHFSGADTLNSPRIFDGRLTYAKGGAILHTLRFVTNNDSLWFKTLRDFQYAFGGKTASATDFMNFYQTKTAVNPTQFFNQWYYGEGFPAFQVKYNYGDGNLYMKVTQGVSMASKTPLFITPVEYRIFRTGKADTIIRLMHDEPVENYVIPMTGTVQTIHVDPRNWIIDNSLAPSRDFTLGIAPQLRLPVISISPNPSPGRFLVETESKAGGSLTIRDISGRLVQTLALKPQTEVSLENCADGVYLLQISGTKGEVIHSQKIIKSR